MGWRGGRGRGRGRGTEGREQERHREGEKEGRERRREGERERRREASTHLVHHRGVVDLASAEIAQRQQGLSLALQVRSRGSHG